MPKLFPQCILECFPLFTLQIDWFSMHFLLFHFAHHIFLSFCCCCCFCSVCFSSIFKNMLSSHQTAVMPFVECSLLCNFSTCISLVLAMQNNVQYFYDTFEIFCSAHHSTLQYLIFTSLVSQCSKFYAFEKLKTFANIFSSIIVLSPIFLSLYFRSPCSFFLKAFGSILRSFIMYLRLKSSFAIFVKQCHIHSGTFNLICHQKPHIIWIGNGFASSSTHKTLWFK